MGSPGWAHAGVSLPWDLYVEYRRPNVLAENFEAARRWVDFVHSNNPDLIWKNNRGKDWGDWLSAGRRLQKKSARRPFSPIPPIWLRAWPGCLGRNADAEYYGGLFQDIRRAFVKNYVSTMG